jgi:hypothetical protein
MFVEADRGNWLNHRRAKKPRSTQRAMTLFGTGGKHILKEAGVSQ